MLIFVQEEAPRSHDIYPFELSSRHPTPSPRKPYSTMTMPTPLPSILVIYTGGTIGMLENPETGALEPLDFNYLQDNVPELRHLGCDIESVEFRPPLDSSAISPEHWVELAQLIASNYTKYDGFVVLHGTDTMAYTASAISFVFEGLAKPIIFTGSQLPVGKLRTDGKENLITALEIAAARDAHGRPRVPEVALFFENYLMRGNRTSKISADQFHAFESYNYPHLAYAGIEIRYHEGAIARPDEAKPFVARPAFDPNVAVLKLFPGITQEVVEAILTLPSLRGVVLETFGSGNAPMVGWFLDALRSAVERGVVIVNVTQCVTGYVDMGRYETGILLQRLGLVSGRDATTEATLTKLMYLFGQGLPSEEVKRLMTIPLRGELSLDQEIEGFTRELSLYRR